MSLEEQVNSLDEEVRSETVCEKFVNDQKFYVLEGSSSYAGNILRSRSNAADQISDFSEEIVQKMIEDVNFRNFVCSNFREFVDNVDPQRHYTPNYAEGFIDQSDFGSKSIRRVKKIGFMRNGASLVDEPEKEQYFSKMTGHYKDQYGRLYGTGYSLDFDNHMKSPLIQTATIMDCAGYIHNGEGFISFNTKSPEAQAFLRAQQYNMIYEEFIAGLILDEIDEAEEVVSEPCILTSPNLDNNGNLKGYMELDGFLLSSGGRLILIECKNTRFVKQKHLAKFLGKARLIEDIYGVEVDKYLVSTGNMGWMVDGIKENGIEDDIGIFGVESHRKNYSDLIRAIDQR